MNHQK